MSQVRFCDQCGNPFPTNQIGHQNIVANTLGWNGHSFVTTRQDFDLCANCALTPDKMPTNQPPKEIVGTVTNESTGNPSDGETLQ